MNGEMVYTAIGLECFLDFFEMLTKANNVRRNTLVVKQVADTPARYAQKRGST